MKRKRLSFCVFPLTYLGVLVAVFTTLPFVAYSQTPAELQRRIDTLKDTIENLQSELEHLSFKKTTDNNKISQKSLISRTLSLGSTGQDVYNLQVRLNKNLSTQVSKTGPGAPGQETFYFGQKTQRAVKVFQKLHRADILTPLGLSQGTGVVGPRTRQALLNEDAFGDRYSSKDSETQSLSEGPHIERLSPSRGSFGERVTVYGSGFTGDNDVYGIASNTPSKDGKTLSFILSRPEGMSELPENIDTSYDLHYTVYIYVENIHGRSEAVPFTINI